MTSAQGNLPNLAAEAPEHRGLNTSNMVSGVHFSKTHVIREGLQGISLPTRENRGSKHLDEIRTDKRGKSNLPTLSVEVHAAESMMAAFWLFGSRTSGRAVLAK